MTVYLYVEDARGVNFFDLLCNTLQSGISSHPNIEKNEEVVISDFVGRFWAVSKDRGTVIVEVGKDDAVKLYKGKKIKKLI